MIPMVGLIVAIYAVARLIQVPIEQFNRNSTRWLLLLLVSAPAILAIGFLAVSLVTSGVDSDLPRIP